jgi:hypothetical protein
MAYFYAEISSSLFIFYFILFNKIELNGKLKPPEIKHAWCDRPNDLLVSINERHFKPSSKRLYSRDSSISQIT